MVCDIVFRMLTCIMKLLLVLDAQESEIVYRTVATETYDQLWSPNVFEVWTDNYANVTFIGHKQIQG